ncbi:MAG: chemotaxis protein CheW [Cyanobacteria bacterium P01_A01_bin.135]
MVGNPDFLTAKGQEVPDIQELDSPEGELYLRFLTASKSQFALPATGILEVVSPSPERITPIPNISPLLLGTLNMRGRVVWVADLGQFLGEEVHLSLERFEIPVIAVEDQDIRLGLAVDRIIDMDWLSMDEIQMTTNLPDSMAPFVRGEWHPGRSPSSEDNSQGSIAPGGHDPLRLLDQMAILRSARWAA